MKIATATITTLAVIFAAIAAALATASGVIQTVTWACRSFGDVPVAIVGAFIAGVVITHAIERAIAARHEQTRSEPADTEG